MAPPPYLPVSQHRQRTAPRVLWGSSSPWTQGQSHTEHLRASPQEPEEPHGLAFDVQVSSCSHSQALWVTAKLCGVNRASPPLARSVGGEDQGSLGGGPPSAPPSSRVPTGGQSSEPAAHSRRQRQGWRKEGPQRGWSSRSPGLASCPSAGTCLVQQVLVFPTPTPASLPRSMWLSCFPKCLFVPSPSPPRACTQILRNIRSRGGAAAAPPELPRPCVWGEPSTEWTFTLSPGDGQTPHTHPGTLLLFHGCPPPIPFLLCQGQQFTCQLLHHPFPPSPRTSPHFFQPSH